MPIKLRYCHFVLFFIIVVASCKSSAKDEHSGWSVYGGSKENIRYSSLNQIDTSNVSRITVAWTYHTGDAGEMTQLQVNPIIIDGILYGVSPKLKLFAVDAATGKEKWSFNPFDTTKIKGAGYFMMNACRGVSYYSDGKNDKRIFFAAGSHLFCIDAMSGELISSFGDNGKIDLHNDLGKDVKDLYVATTTPGIIYKDMIIIGSRVAEEAAAAPGHIRSYDVHTGKLRWVFHTIPQPGEEGYETWDQQVPLLMIFMEAKEQDKIFLRIPFLPLTHQPANGCGIFKRYIMMYGTGTFRQRRS